MGKSRKTINVAAAPASIPQTKDAKKDKRCAGEATEERASSKKQKIETVQVDQNKKKVKKLKKALIEASGEKKDDGRSSDFEERFAAAPIMFPPTKAAAKGKRGAVETTEKQRSSKSYIIDVGKVGQSKKMAKKLKKILIESPMKMKDETGSSDFGVEKSCAIKTKPISAARKKPELNDGSSKSDSDDEDGVDVSFSVKHVGRCSSLLPKKVTDNKRRDSLADANNKEISKIFEKEPGTPVKQNEVSGTKRLFVGNLPPEVTKDDLFEFFKKYGEVTEVRLATKEDGSFRGFGHVEFVTEAGAQAALRMNGDMFLGRPLIVDLARERGSNAPHEGKETGSYKIRAHDPGHSVYVKGFGKSIEENQIRNSLKEHFGSYGEIIRVSIPQDSKTGRSKGFAYVLFNDQATASKAIELNGTELGGYVLTVQEPIPKIGPRDGSYSGGRGMGGRSAGQGGGGKGRGRGGRGPGASYNSSATHSKGDAPTLLKYHNMDQE